MRIDERHTSELLGQSTRTMVLPSGLTVQMCRMPGFVTAYAMLTVGVGSIDIGYRVRGREVSLPARGGPLPGTQDVRLPLRRRHAAL